MFDVLNIVSEHLAIEMTRLDAYFLSHLIATGLSRSDDFEAFMRGTQKRLLGLIEETTGKVAYLREGQDEEVAADPDVVEAELVISVWYPCWSPSVG